MAVRIALRHSREDGARPMTGSFRHDFIASTHWEPSNLPFPITAPTEYESHRDRCARREKERIRTVEARLVADMEATEAADVAARATKEEEAICARIVKKRQWRNIRTLVREQNRAVHAMAGLPPKEEKDVSADRTTSATSRSGSIPTASSTGTSVRTARAPGRARAAKFW